jgi:hypothetical protein
MNETLQTLLSTTQGTVLLFAAFLVIVALIIFIIIKVVPRITHVGKGGINLRRKDDDYQTLIPHIKDIISSEYDKYIDLKEELLLNIDKEIKSKQQLSVFRSIDYLCLEFGSLSTVSDSKKSEELINQMNMILELYLYRDFSNILMNRLNQLYSSLSFQSKSDLEINNEITLVTDDILRVMKTKVKDYILISERKLILSLYDKATPKIRETVDDAIKSFLSLSKDKKDKIIQMNEERNKKIDERIQEIKEKED